VVVVVVVEVVVDVEAEVVVVVVVVEEDVVVVEEDVVVEAEVQALKKHIIKSLKTNFNQFLNKIFTLISSATGRHMHMS
jgi:hypothetical protein